MSLSIYQASVPAMLHFIQQMQGILDKAQQFAEQRKVADDVLPGLRLCPDMLPLRAQVYIVSDVAKGCAARLAGVDVPSFADVEITIPDLKARLDKTTAFIQTLLPSQFEGAESRSINLKMGGHEITLSGADYVFRFVLPNFYFHITTAYALLRSNGVALSKQDYLGGV